MKCRALHLWFAAASAALVLSQRRGSPRQAPGRPALKPSLVEAPGDCLYLLDGSCRVRDQGEVKLAVDVYCQCDRKIKNSLDLSKFLDGNLLPRKANLHKKTTCPEDPLRRSPGDEECSGVYRGDVGSILSPDWPQVYPNNRYCVYHVTVTPETCGSTSMDPITSSSHELVLVFRSDGSVQRNGFNITYTSSGCGNPAIPRVQWVVPGSRVVGGTEAEPGSWPWQVSLRPVDDETWHFCGGSIINEDWVVTAAHCVDGDYKPLVVVGEHSRTDPADDPERAVVATAKTINHPGFVWWTMVNDIALLKLASPLTFSDRVSPVCLSDTSMVTSPTTFCTITGWGTMAEGGDCCPNKLQQADVPIVEDDHCENTYQRLFRQSLGLVPRMRPAKHICAGYTEGGVDSCQGDSGGPLTCQAPDGTYYQAGVVSYGEGCGQEDIPGVYTEVSSVYEWIHECFKHSETFGWHNRTIADRDFVQHQPTTTDLVPDLLLTMVGRSSAAFGGLYSPICDRD
ncbi:hypothetical protein Bbelb_016220 [Branchiostoma belcheri]|nr:hypothetical protein Bbelb_016220 [Branchiostoma belcheri]